MQLKRLFFRTEGATFEVRCNPNPNPNPNPNRGRHLRGEVTLTLTLAEGATFEVRSP